MNNKKRKWTEAEDDIVFYTISENSANITEACKKLAEQLNRTPKSIRLRWYSVLTNIEHPKYKKGACFILLNRTKATINRKNSNTPNKPIKKSLWNKILHWLGIQ